MISSYPAELFGYVSVAAVSPRVTIADPHANLANILEALGRPDIAGADIVVLPELALSGYTCGDLFFQDSLISASKEALLDLCSALKDDQRLVAVGLPVKFEGRLYNCAALICRGDVLGIVPKINIPNYQEFYEKRWFSSGKDIKGKSVRIGSRDVPFGSNLIFSHLGVKVGVEICEDLWVPVPPSSYLAKAGAEIILNLSATDDNIGKYDYIRSLVSSQSSRCRCLYAYASAGAGESSTDLVFSGIDLIGFDGKIVGASPRFSGDAVCAVAVADIEKLRNDRRKYSSFHESPAGPDDSGFEVLESPVASREGKIFNLPVDPLPFVPSDPRERDSSCREIVEIQSWGLNQRLKATNCKNLVIGISGGLDSTLSLLVAHHSFTILGLDLKGIHAVTMPADATSSRTLSNSLSLMEKLGVTVHTIPIMEAVNRHFQDIGHTPDVYDAVYENSQARERTQILMDLANKYNGMVLGTGDMSEMALGWCTYNGDHMSMYNVNAGVPKTLVRHLVKWFADKADASLKAVLDDVLSTPISPELVPGKSGNDIAQKTELIVGPYELHDFFLFHTIRNGFSPTKIMFLARHAFRNKFEDKVIKHWLVNFYRRFFSQQFKRSCMPDGPKIGSVCLSPRGDWRMPSDASAALWVNEAENIRIDDED